MEEKNLTRFRVLDIVFEINTIQRDVGYKCNNSPFCTGRAGNCCMGWHDTFRFILLPPIYPARLTEFGRHTWLHRQRWGGNIGPNRLR
ncbi:MAG: hypothetical protein RIQ78_408 [Bacteroidota bacterium]